MNQFIHSKQGARLKRARIHFKRYFARTSRIDAVTIFKLNGGLIVCVLGGCDAERRNAFLKGKKGNPFP